MYDEAIKSKVKEGRRVGKNPWCCDSYVEDCAYRILNAETWPRETFPQETFKETRKRWCEEGIITKEDLEQDRVNDIKWKESGLMWTVKGTLQELGEYIRTKEYSAGFLEELMSMGEHHKIDMRNAFGIVKEKLLVKKEK